MKNLENQIIKYKSLEKYSHISIDDVINKVTQEICELIEADISWDEQEVYKEAWDALVNVLSVSHEYWLDYEVNRNNNKKDNLWLSVLLWKWNTKIQWLRNRYSREKVSINEVESITKELVENILSYVSSDLNVNELINNNIQKFDSRKDMYKPQIDLSNFIDDYPDFPIEWINFKDISKLLENPDALKFTIFELSDKCKDSDIIVWLDARWFIFWSLVAQNLSKPFIMLRKKGKLPWKTNSIDYWLEYWKSTLEIQSWKIEKWQSVSIIDDLLATWWTVKAAIDLLEAEWWKVENIAFVISLNDNKLSSLQSRIDLNTYKLDSLVNYN